MIFWIAFGVSAMLRSKSGIKIAIWGCLAITIVVFEAFGFFCWKERENIIALRCLYGENRHNCGRFTATFYTYCAFAFWGIGIAYMIWMGFLFNRINLAIGFFKAALPFTKKLKEIRWLPLYGVTMMGAFMMFFIWTIFESSSVVNKAIIEAQSKSLR